MYARPPTLLRVVLTTSATPNQGLDTTVVAGAANSRIRIVHAYIAQQYNNSGVIEILVRDTTPTELFRMVWAAGDRRSQVYDPPEPGIILTTGLGINCSYVSTVATQFLIPTILYYTDTVT